MATAAEISADIDAVRAARLALAKGERIDEVMRDGRRLIYGKVTIDALTNLLNVLEQDHEKAVAAEAGGPRRRPINLAWHN